MSIIDKLGPVVFKQEWFTNHQRLRQLYSPTMRRGGGICRSEGTDENILFELSLTSSEWLKRGCWDWMRPTPHSKSTQLGLLHKKACMELSSYKKTRVEASSDPSCFNIPHSQCLPLWLYNQTPLPFLAQSYKKLLASPVLSATYTGPYNTQYSGLTSDPGHDAKVCQDCCISTASFLLMNIL